MNGTLSAVGVGNALLVGGYQSFTYGLTVAEGESFVGTVTLQRSEHGISWTNLASWTGTAETPLTGTVVATTTTQNSKNREIRYRFAVTTFGEASNGISWDVSAVAEEIVAFADEHGVKVLTVTDDGIETTKVTATTLVVTNLPTEDPGVAGAFWLDSGALKVSTGS